MARLQVGGADELGELFDRYSDRAFRLALSVCQDSSLAEDAVQDAFVSIFRARSTYRSDRGSVSSWVMAVAYHRSLDLVRRRAREALWSAGEEQLASRPAPGDVTHAVLAASDAHQIRTLLDALPESQREVITLAFYGELSHREIAHQLALPPGTVKGRIRAGMRQLRSGLAAEHADLSHQYSAYT